jgi:hypothetical protein
MREMTINFRRYTTKNEQGMVSITVAIVFISVISLVVLGFSQVSRRNSRETLDRQLASQAYYAAEVGVNDAMKGMALPISTGQPVPEQTQCNGNQYTKNNGEISTSDPGTKYTCLLVDPTPDKVSYDNVTSGSSVVIPLNANGGDGILHENVIEWTRTASPAPSAKVSDCTYSPGTNPNAAAWPPRCPFGLLKVDLMPIQGRVGATPGTTEDPISAAKATMTMYVYPHPGSTADANLPVVNYEFTAPNAFGTGAPQGKIAQANCDANVCRIKVSNLEFSRAYMRVRSLYQTAQNLQVQATDGGSFARAQAVVDVTGKAQDVLRRIQVTISLSGGVGNSTRTDAGGYSDYGVQTSKSICKRYTISPEVGGSDLPACN